MQQKRRARVLQPAPNGIVPRMAGRAPAGRMGRNPNGAEAQPQSLVDGGEPLPWIVERCEGDADQALVAGAELGHRAVVRIRRGVARIVRRGEDLRGAEGREDHLAPKTQQIEREAAFLAVERAQGIVPLWPPRDAFAERHELRDRLRRMAAGTLKGAHLVAHVRQTDVRQAGQPLPHATRRVAREEIRQLHQMAVGVGDRRHFRRGGRGVGCGGSHGVTTAARLPLHALRKVWPLELLRLACPLRDCCELPGM